jgi:CRP/FNR family transcriptional regulator
MKQSPSRLDDHIVTLWHDVPYLSDLPRDVVRALSQVATRSRYEAGETVFLEGDPIAGLYIVQEGAVKISRFSQDGREHIFHIFYPGDTFNEVAAMDGGPNPVTATAHTDAVLWRISRDDLQDVAHRYPALTWALLVSISRRARQLVGIVQDLSMRNVKGRVARLLLEQAEIAGSDDHPERMLTQEEMASRNGAGLLVEVNPGEKARPIHLLSSADIDVTDFEME